MTIALPDRTCTSSPSSRDRSTTCSSWSRRSHLSGTKKSPAHTRATGAMRMSPWFNGPVDGRNTVAARLYARTSRLAARCRLGSMRQVLLIGSGRANLSACGRLVQPVRPRLPSLEIEGLTVRGTPGYRDSPLPNQAKGLGCPLHLADDGRTSRGNQVERNTFAGILAQHVPCPDSEACRRPLCRLRKDLKSPNAELGRANLACHESGERSTIDPHCSCDVLLVKPRCV